MAMRVNAVTRRCLNNAIAVCGPGVPVRDVGLLISALAKSEGLSVVPEYLGHGIGQTFHTLPLVHHGDGDATGVFRKGMTFTIEPILVSGSPEVGRCARVRSACACLVTVVGKGTYCNVHVQVLHWDDGWTACAVDGGLSAQFEHTMLVTDNGVEILTTYDGDVDEKHWNV